MITTGKSLHQDAANGYQYQLLEIIYKLFIKESFIFKFALGW